ncbi:hypothetical protein GK047_08040 [Paenibacillus sp. SYP-B3998]|uniref:Copper amine oxidase-like N-terminal domain-containing protein n=1 Tax=Paenibacillus sp. SYP-B3998 TaxID=2678564 RepID=A0A6G3ZV90_9BACL|nr:stalk domain-containing protein [Paenibacillus sp. SYP-B3998]NEW05958.1 hypothetical protein [Paenibacillus sp. SYP-B3998]
MKRVIGGLFLGISLTFTSVSSASTSTLEVFNSPVKYVFNGAEILLDEEYTSLNYNGHMYAPIRFVANNLGSRVDYSSETNTLIFDSPPTTGVGHRNVSRDQAKIVAYEKYQLKHVDSDTSIRVLTDDEKKQIPDEAKDGIPVYYFVKGVDDSEKEITICVWSMNKEVSFVYSQN